MIAPAIRCIRIHSCGIQSVDQSLKFTTVPKLSITAVTMTYKLNKEGVITGSLNSFCLACEIFLNSQREAANHVQTLEHKKKSTAVEYSEKFKDEHIKKFKGGYFCEFCNVLMAISSKVNLHVIENEHKHNKGILLLKPMGGAVIAFNNILIEEKAWHGLIDDVCSLCNVEFEDENDHKTDAGHSLNLVLKPIQFGADSAIYRHLDETSVQCLTCNKLLAPGKIAKHFEDTEHHELYTKHRIETNGVSHETENEENDQEVKDTKKCQEVGTKENGQEKATNINSVKENKDEKQKSKKDNDAMMHNKSKILESIAKYQTKGININLETETAFCKKCSNVITFDYTEIEKHMENHSTATKIDADLQYPSNLDQNLNRVDINDKTTQSSDNKQNTVVLNDTSKALPDKEKSDDDSDSSDSDWNTFDDEENSEKGSQEKEAKDFAKENKITYNGGVNQSFCRICNVHVPASLRSMREHVDGANHKKLAPSTPLTQPTARGRQTTRQFIDSAYDVQGYFYTASLINEKYCITLHSLYLITENNSRMKCILCEMNLPPYTDLVDHAKEMYHINKWKMVPVLTSERNEFIREVRPGLYHCGFCHLAISGWDNMKQHLVCFDHRDNRSTAERRLRQHLPGLQQFRMRERQMEVIAMMRLFNMLS